MTSRKSAREWVDPDASGAAILQPDGARSEDQAEQRFKYEGSRWNDWWIIPIWILHLAAFIAIGFTAYGTYKNEMNTPVNSALANRTAPSLTPAAFAIVGILIATALTIAVLFLLAVRLASKHVLWASLISFSFYIAALAVYAGVMHKYVSMAILCAFLLVYGIYLYAVRERVAFSANVLDTVAKLIFDFPSAFAVAFGGLVFQAAWFVMWLVMAVSIFYSLHIEFDNGKPVSTSDKEPTKNVVNLKLAMVLFAVLVCFFWTSQVIKNIVHVTVSGVTATWYFLFPNSIPANSPTMSSLKRACTTSLGSVILASLVNAVVSALRATVHLIRGWVMSEETNCITVAVLCIVDCLLNMIEQIVKYINAYSLSYVAVYGKSYFESSKMTFQLMKTRGLDAVVNDDIIGISLFMCALLSGGLCAVLSGFLANKVFAVNGDWQVWALMGFILGLFLTMTVMSVIESAVITLFVCLADDPIILKNTKREVYDKLVPDIEQRYSDIDLQPMNAGRREEHV